MSTLTVIAKVKLLPSESGGRTAPIYTGYRPNHNFGSIGQPVFAMGQIYLENENGLSPGDEVNAAIRFSPSKPLLDAMRVGASWKIQEANRVVGEATCEQIVDSAPEPTHDR